MKQPGSDIQALLKALRERNLTRSEWDQLHAAAADDPFLADALEGLAELSYEERNAHITSLENALTPHPSEQKKRGIIWLRVAAAVAVLVVAVYAVVFLLPSPGPEPLSSELDGYEGGKNDPGMTQMPVDPPMAEEYVIEEQEFSADEEVESHSDPQESHLAQGGEIAQQEAATHSDREKFTRQSAPTPSMPQDERPITAMAPVPQNDFTVASAPIIQDTTASNRNTIGLSVDNMPPGSRADEAPKITGRVTDNSGEPVFGANVFIANTASGTITDPDGEFDLPINREDSATGVDLVISYTGFETQTLHARPGADVDISMDQDAALDEVVILENSSKESALPLAEFGPGRALATPVRGEKHYSRYLKKNLVMPEAAVAAGISGKVELEFTLDAEGRPDDIKVVRSLGYGCDDEAIRLVREGPAWDVEQAQVPIGRISIRFGE